MCISIPSLRRCGRNRSAYRSGQKVVFYGLIGISVELTSELSYDSDLVTRIPLAFTKVFKTATDWNFQTT